MRRLALVIVIVLLVAGTSLFIPAVRGRVRALIRPEPPAQITPIALSVPASIPTSRPRPTPTGTTIPATATPTADLPLPTAAQSATSTPGLPTATPTIEPTPEPTIEPTPEPTAGPVEVNGRIYDAYIPAANKPGQFFQYSCEFDAAWVVLKTYGIEASGDEIIGAIDHDRSVEPYIKETREGYLIYGGDIEHAYSGDYTHNFLARSTGTAMQKVFDRYGLDSQPVQDRAALEAALRAGELVWIKTTVDFKPWRPATWVMPDGRTHKTVLGNDHAVVVMGFNASSVVIRDVLGPTSTNRQRPYEYEVGWDTFMAAWGAQSFDGLAVAPPVQE
ncbi:MAG TPA: C39 family peptidase [Herpetosiphonaceae bacterium]